MESPINQAISGATESPARAPEPASGVLQAAPFLKWAGGKAGLIPQLEALFPARFRRYHEPFLGGGAVFLHLSPSSAYLSDLNARLIDCFAAVRDEVDAVIGHLERLKHRHGKAHYYRARDLFNRGQELPRAHRAALQIYLNKTCYNGLYRENARGHFNVPVGSYRNPGIFDSGNLRAVSRRLRRAQIDCQPFEAVLERAQPGDFIYFDPPYAPLSTTSNFTSYTRHGFTSFDQARLRDLVRLLDQRGCLVLVSNSSARLIRDLYQGFHISTVRARRSINSKGNGRGRIEELAIRNYE